MRGWTLHATLTQAYRGAVGGDSRGAMRGWVGRGLFTGASTVGLAAKPRGGSSPQQAKQLQAEKAAAAAKAAAKEEAEAVAKEKKKPPRTSGFFDDEPEHLNGRLLQQKQEFDAKVKR
jgi:hypothetical protein